MSDEVGFADPLSYDDTPYESQVLEEDSTTVTSLKKRIGNRIYLYDSGSLNKRKRTDEDEDNIEEETSPVDAADFPHRPNAILLQGLPITQMPTNRVFAYATHFDIHPIGLEWVDDQTCILVFTNRKRALHAWNALRKQRAPTSGGDMMSMDIDDADDESLHPAHPVPLALYPIEDRISSLLGTKKSDLLKQPIHVRWARRSDVKQRNARKQSEFYRKFGGTAGKPGSSLLPPKPLDVLNENSSGRLETPSLRLRDEIEDEALTSPIRERPSNDVDDTRRRNEEAERRRRLDYELDAFLASGGDEPVLESVAATTAQERDEVSSSRPSLLERTRPRSSRSRSPRRRRDTIRSLQRPDVHYEQTSSGRQYQTDSNGRWLHNAEVAQLRRRRTDYDADAFGMRAWDDERPLRPLRPLPRRKPHKRARKTQDELDKELEELAGQESTIY